MQHVQDLAHAQAAAECLTDYTEPKQRDGGSQSKNRRGGQSRGHGKLKNEGAKLFVAKGHLSGGRGQQKSYGDKGKAPQNAGNKAIPLVSCAMGHTRELRSEL